MKSMINWFSLPSTDFKRAVGFYNEILDIEVVVSKDGSGNDLGYFFDPTEQGINGGITSNPDEKPGVDGTTVYLNAEGKLDEVVGKVKGAGGQVAMPKTSIGPNGFIAMIMDTEGNLVGLHSMT